MASSISVSVSLSLTHPLSLAETSSTSTFSSYIPPSFLAPHTFVRSPHELLCSLGFSFPSSTFRIMLSQAQITRLAWENGGDRVGRVRNPEVYRSTHLRQRDNRVRCLRQFFASRGSKGLRGDIANILSAEGNSPLNARHRFRGKGRTLFSLYLRRTMEKLGRK